MRFLLVDDHGLFRGGMRLMLQTALPEVEVHDARSVEEMFQMLSEAEFSLICLDLSLPGSSGLEALKQIKRGYPTIPVLVLSMHSEAQYATRALRAGASGYLTKDKEPEELLRAINRAVSGGTYITESQSLALVREVTQKSRSTQRLSDREFEVLKSLARGLTVTETAAEMGLSVKTVSTYRSRMLEKLDLSSNSELIEFARGSGLI